MKGTIPVTVNLGETMSAIIFRDGIRRVGTVYQTLCDNEYKYAFT